MDVDGCAQARGDRGVVTAEYATCSFAAASFGLLLYKFLTSPRVHDTLFDVIGTLLRWPF